MTAALATIGAVITAWSVTGTEPPRVYAWTIGVAFLMLAWASWLEHRWDEDERRRRHEWDRRWDR